jgi:hypothetical protein
VLMRSEIGVWLDGQGILDLRFSGNPQCLKAVLATRLAFKGRLRWAGALRKPSVVKWLS